MRGSIIIEIHACIEQGKEQIRLGGKIYLGTGRRNTRGWEKRGILRKGVSSSK